MPLTLTTPPAVEPISTAEAKAHIRVDHSDDDTYIDTLVSAARQDTERVTWRQMITATYTLTLDRFPENVDFIELPRPPLQAVSSITYVDVNGDTQTWADTNYTVATGGGAGRVNLVAGKVWPSMQTRFNSVTITYTAGYGDASTDVPEVLRQGMLLKIGHWYENREAVVIGGTPMSLPIATERIDNLYKFRSNLNIYTEGLTRA